MDMESNSKIIKLAEIRTDLVPVRRYLLPDTDEPDNYATEDLGGAVALPEVANGEYLPEPPDPKTVSCNGFLGTARYDQMSIDDGVEMLRAMGAVAHQLNDDLKVQNAAQEEAEVKLGTHIALKLLPGLEYYRHIFKQHNGERDFRIVGCKGIEALENKIGIPPATVRTWRQRYRHLPEYQAALAAHGILIEQKPERIKQCDNCGTRINLPDGEEPDHAECCPQHPMRREAMDVVRDLAIRGETYKRIACGEGKYAMLPEKSRIQKIQEFALGTPSSDLVELDDLSVLLNRIRGQEMDEMLSMVKEYYSHQQERLSIFGIELVIRENSEASATQTNNGNIQSAVTGGTSEQEAPTTEDRNVTQEEGRCVAEPAEEVSNATEQPSVALPDATGNRNVTCAPTQAVTVTLTAGGTESTPKPSVEFPHRRIVTIRLTPLMYEALELILAIMDEDGCSPTLTTYTQKLLTLDLTTPDLAVVIMESIDEMMTGEFCASGSPRSNGHHLRALRNLKAEITRVLGTSGFQSLGTPKSTPATPTESTPEPTPTEPPDSLADILPPTVEQHKTKIKGQAHAI